jgi:predicted RNA binding protein YcfA (HicA-like mRNA interferase family)
LADLPTLPHFRVVRALERAGFRVIRQGKHVVMSDGKAVVSVPRHNPVNRWTLAGIIEDAGLTVKQFRELC